MGWGGLDQRTFPRVSARCDILIHDRIGGTIKAKTQNLGAGGACVILKRELEKLSQVRLRLTLDDPSKPIECNSRVVWMVRSKEPSSGKVSFDIGVEFLGLDVKDQERIASFSQRQSRV